MNQIKTLLLDIGQVVVALDFPAALRQIMAYTDLDAAEIRCKLSDSKDVVLYEQGLISTQEFHVRISRLLEMRATLEEFKRTWEALFAFHGHDGRCVSEFFFRRLQRKYRIVALSNTNEMHFEYLESALPLIKMFDDHVLSFRVGAVKPDRAIYEAALELTGCTPEEVFFVDDMPANVEGAALLGIKGVVYTNEARLQADLEAHGLLE